MPGAGLRSPHCLAHRLRPSSSRRVWGAKVKWTDSLGCRTQGALHLLTSGPLPLPEPGPASASPSPTPGLSTGPTVGKGFLFIVCFHPHSLSVAYQ